MKNILIAIPELSYSGSVYSALRIARVLKKKYHVDLISYEEGAFRKEYETEGIEISVIDKNCIYGNGRLEKHLLSYDLIIVNTIIMYALADYSKNIIPTIWYIREAHNLSWQFFRYDYRRYYALKRADNIYAVSEYAADYIKCINTKVRVIHNCVEDVYSKYAPTAKKDRIIRFLMLGTLEPRKAFDVAIRSYKKIENNLKEHSELHFVGRQMGYAKDYAMELLKLAESTEGVFYHGEIQDRDELMHLMANSDVIVVPSKDESCSLVALEGAMMAKPLILSQNIGAKYLLKDEDPLVFQTDNEDSLAEKMSLCINGKEKLAEIGNTNRVEYLKTSTFDIYEMNILQMVEDNLIDDLLRFREERKLLALAEEKQRVVENSNREPLYMFGAMPKKNDEIVIYGAGEVGIALVRKCRSEGIGFEWTDSSDAKWGKIIEGEKIQSLREMSFLNKKIYIAVYSKKIADTIIHDLKEIAANAVDIIWVNPGLIRK